MVMGLSLLFLPTGETHLLLGLIIRKPLTPPNRPLAFILGASFVVVGAGLMTGGLTGRVVPDKIAEHEFDRHPNKNLSKVIC